MRATRRGRASLELRKVEAILALAAELMTFQRILDRAWIVPFGTMEELGGMEGCIGLWPRKLIPAARLRAFGTDRYDALLWAWSTMLLS